MKTIMIIGAGFGQIPAIDKARELGHKVIAVDKNKDAEGMKKADIALNIDIINIDEIVKAAKKYRIDGIMTMQSDIGVPAVGAVIDELSLNGVGLEVANRCSNKIETRELFKKHNVPQPRFRVIVNYEEAVKAANSLGYPCIIKAPDSSASRGVTKVNTVSEVRNAYDEGMLYTKIGKLLVEEYISGKEIGSQTFSLEGKCVKVLVHNDTISKPPYMIPIGHSFPSKLPKDIVFSIVNASKVAVDALGILSGPANVDIIISKDNQPMIIEIGARIGATCLPELIEYYTGINWVEETIKNSLNEKVSLENKKEQPVAAVILEAPTNGIYNGVIEPTDLLGKSVVEWEVTLNIGEKVSRLTKGTDRIGKLIVVADSVGEAEEKSELMKSKFIYRINEK